MTQDRPPALSDSELELLKTIWELGGEATVREVAEHPGAAREGRAYTTVQTLLNRLVDKAYASTERRGRVLVYRAAVDRDELVARQLDEIAERVCDGNASPLVLNLAKAASFTQDDIDSFRRLLDELEAKADSKRKTPERGTKRGKGRGQ
ncbi:MAG: BlaI/MecI/CopY family transcriptional regulator [Phycisphaerales bacterium]